MRTIFALTVALVLTACEPIPGVDPHAGDIALAPTAVESDPYLAFGMWQDECEQGETVDHDTGREPLFWYAEIGFGPPEATTWQRAEPGWASNANAPVYRRGSVITVTCGDPAEVDGPWLEGSRSGAAQRFRITWVFKPTDSPPEVTAPADAPSM